MNAHFTFVLFLIFICSSQMQCKKCGSDSDCSPLECCASEMTVTSAKSAPTVKWKCKELGNLGEICNNISNQYCKCTVGLRCHATGSWFFGSGMCVEEN